jgi:hypothetical protein
MTGSSRLTTHAQRIELAAIVENTIRSRPLGNVADLARAIIEDIEGADWKIAKANTIPIRSNPGDAEMVADKTRPSLGGKRSVLPVFSRCRMREPIVVTVPHRLGRDEAKRRLVDGLQQVDKQIASQRASLDYSWEQYRINFSVRAMRQRLDGHTDVEDEIVRIEIQLPFLLRMLADPLASRVENDTELLLNKAAI